MRILLILGFLAVSAVNVSADMTVKDYKKSSSGDAVAILVMKSYVQGLGDGIGWANIAATHDKKPMYCAPQRLSLGLENFLDIINRQIDIQAKQLTQAELDDSLLGLMLMLGMVETFPCPAK